MDDRDRKGPRGWEGGEEGCRGGESASWGSHAHLLSIPSNPSPVPAVKPRVIPSPVSLRPPHPPPQPRLQIPRVAHKNVCQSLGTAPREGPVSSGCENAAPVTGRRRLRPDGRPWSIGRRSGPSRVCSARARSFGSPPHSSQAPTVPFLLPIRICRFSPTSPKAPRHSRGSPASQSIWGPRAFAAQCRSLNQVGCSASRDPPVQRVRCPQSQLDASLASCPPRHQGGAPASFHRNAACFLFCDRTHIVPGSHPGLCLVLALVTSHLRESRLSCLSSMRAAILPALLSTVSQ